MARRNDDLDSFARSLVIFGSELKHYREASGRSQRQLAEDVHCARSLIGMIETGQRAPVDDDFPRRCDELLNTGGALERLWKRMTAEDESEHPDWFRRYVTNERIATTIRQFEVQLIPGLLQTEEYARALFRTKAPVGDLALLAERVAARMGRQHILRREDPPQFFAILDEGVLRRTVGGPSVMHRQLRHLLTMSRMPNVVIQIAEFGLAEHVLFDAPMTLLTVPEEPDLLYFEALGRGQLISIPGQVAMRSAQYDRLRADALSRRDSLRMIRSVMEGTTNVSPTNLGAAAWRKSTYSSSEGGQCIEVADGVPGVLPVRDSKDPHGPALLFPATSWSAFVTGVRAGDFPVGL